VGDFGELEALCALGFDKALDKLLGEDAVGGEVVVIGFEGVEGFTERGGEALELFLFLLGEVEEVEVVGAPAVFVGVDFVLYAVEASHKDCRVAEIGVAGGVGVAKLEAALIGAFRVGGNTDNRRAV